MNINNMICKLWRRTGVCAALLTIALSLATCWRAHAQAFNTLFSFSAGPDGINPRGRLAQDTQGNLYGATRYGGAYNNGMIFKLAPSGNETVLYSFTGGTDGAYPSGGLALDTQGNLYGTTYEGGDTSSFPYGNGVLFKLDTSGNFSVLYTFTGGSVGAHPNSDLMMDSQGNLYGTTQSAGNNDSDVVFKLDTYGNYSVLHTFGGSDNGAAPNGGLIQDAQGSLYGTTVQAIFKLDPSGNYTELYHFTGGNDGNGPNGDMVLDAHGCLYGTTYFGGASDNGVVFKLDPAGNFSVFHSFTGGIDGAFPDGGLVQDTQGNLYGLTSNRQTSNNNGYGVVYKLDSSGSFSVLYSFSGGTDGNDPTGALVQDAQGNLYGTTLHGGLISRLQPNGFGVVFKVDPTGQETVLHNFSSSSEGNSPIEGLTRDARGNLYGVAGGGIYGNGVLYKLDASGYESVLHTFTGGTDGANPNGPPVQDAQGNLYGTTQVGGSDSANWYYGAGVVFKVGPSGDYRVLYTFSGGTDGASPNGSLIQDAQGNLYGTTGAGGNLNSGSGLGSGVVFKLDQTGHETVLYTFNGGVDGANPSGNLTLDSQGNLYGTTTIGGAYGYGTIFKLDQTGHKTVLYAFTGEADGSRPNGSLLQDDQGNLFGTTYVGGSAFDEHGYGVVFKLDSAGNFNVLHTFNNMGDGESPLGGLVQDAQGNLYGATEYGPGGEALFELNASGQFSVLHIFPVGRPSGAPIQDAYGNLYGTTAFGGAYKEGSVYELLKQTGAIATALDVPAISSAVGQRTTLEATLTRADTGAPLSGELVNFLINGQFAAAGITDSEGFIAISYRIPTGITGVDVLTATFGGDADYAPGSGQSTLTVGKAYTVLNTQNATGAAGKSVALTATLYRITDNSVLIGQPVSFSVDGTTIGTATTNASGLANLTYSIPAGTALGAHTITTTFAGDADYNASSGTATLTVQANTLLSVPPTSGAIGEKTTLHTTLTRADTGAPLAGESVQFQIDGVKVGSPVQTDANGMAKLPYTVPESLGVGGHTITALFGGDQYYIKSQGSNTLTVSRGAVTIQVPQVRGAAGSTVTLTAVLLNRTHQPIIGRTLRFTVAGQKVGTATTDATGTATLTYTIPAGTTSGTVLKIGVHFPGDTLYHPGAGAGKLIVQ